METIAHSKFADAYSLDNQLPQQRRDVEDGARRRQPCGQSAAYVQRAHRDSSRHLDGVGCPGRNPDPKVRRDQPDARPGRYLHHSAYRIDELIGTMSVFGHVETAGIFIGKRGNRNAVPGVVFGNEALSQCRYIMA